MAEDLSTFDALPQNPIVEQHTVPYARSRAINEHLCLFTSERANHLVEPYVCVWPGSILHLNLYCTYLQLFLACCSAFYSLLLFSAPVPFFSASRLAISAGIGRPSFWSAARRYVHFPIDTLISFLSGVACSRAGQVSILAASPEAQSSTFDEPWGANTRKMVADLVTSRRWRWRLDQIKICQEAQ